MRLISSIAPPPLKRPGATARVSGGRRNLVLMGLNPHRKMAKTPADYAMVVGALVVCVVLLAWAFLG
jgi:hypothetical protein